MVFGSQSYRLYRVAPYSSTAPSPNWRAGHVLLWVFDSFSPATDAISGRAASGATMPTSNAGNSQRSAFREAVAEATFAPQHQPLSFPGDVLNRRQRHRLGHQSRIAAFVKGISTSGQHVMHVVVGRPIARSVAPDQHSRHLHRASEAISPSETGLPRHPSPHSARAGPRFGPPQRDRRSDSGHVPGVECRGAHSGE